MHLVPALSCCPGHARHIPRVALQPWTSLACVWPRLTAPCPHPAPKVELGGEVLGWDRRLVKFFFMGITRWKGSRNGLHWWEHHKPPLAFRKGDLCPLGSAVDLTAACRGGQQARAFPAFLRRSGSHASALVLLQHVCHVPTLRVCEHRHCR